MARDWAGLCPYSKVSKVTVGLESYGAEPRVVRTKHRILGFVLSISMFVFLKFGNILHPANYALCMFVLNTMFLISLPKDLLFRNIPIFSTC